MSVLPAAGHEELDELMPRMTSVAFQTVTLQKATGHVLDVQLALLPGAQVLQQSSDMTNDSSLLESYRAVWKCRLAWLRWYACYWLKAKEYPPAAHGRLDRFGQDCAETWRQAY